MDPSAQTPPPPLKEGRYRLEDVLGEGGMATVFRAFDERLQVPRAIKVLTPAMARSPKIRSRFLSEARTMARLSHPHIVGVVDVDEEAGRPFMVMELLTGGTLWGWVLDHGPMPPRLAVDAVLAVLDGLSAAHAIGVVHRDIKPQNVLLSDDGVVKLTDFGIARVDTADHHTRTAAVMGTWTYMPPEQRSSARDVDGRADLYAVGAMLHALVTGADPPDLFAADMDPELLAPLPDPLQPVVRQATRYKRDERFATAAIMADALRGIRDALPGAASPGRPVAAAPRREITSLPPLSDQLAAAGGRSTLRSSLPPSRASGLSSSPGLATLPPPGTELPLPPPSAGPVAPTRPPPTTTSDPSVSDPSAASRTIAPPVEAAAPDGTLADPRELEGSRPAGIGAPLGLVAVLAVALVGVVLVVREGASSGDAPSDAASALAAELDPSPAMDGAADAAAGAPMDAGAGADPASPGGSLAGVRSPAAASSGTSSPSAASSGTSSPSAASSGTSSPGTSAPAGSSAAPTSTPASASTSTDASASSGPDDGAAAPRGDDTGAASAAPPPAASEPATTTGSAVDDAAPASPDGSGASEAAATEAAATEATATTPASTSSGPPVRVSVTGRVSDLTLVRREDGRRYPLGEVPPGTYVLEGRWFGDEDISTVHELRLISGWDKALKCSDRTRTCR
ncbi:MAG: protein kinase [Alphaproteobacteria bacterium]|nr:protein kinase [Alphaproteobacteria bacterium]